MPLIGSGILGMPGILGTAGAIDPLSLSPAIWQRSDANLYQASTGTGSLAAADGDPVGYWGDRSGNGRHIIQATAGNRPTLKLGIIDGQPVIRFDGVNDYLALSAALGITGGTASGGAMSLFVVVAFRSLIATGIDNRFWQHGPATPSGSSRTITGYLSSTSDWWAWRMNNGNRAFTTTPTVGTFYLVSAVIPAATAYASYPLKVNGTALTQKSTSAGALSLSDTVMILGAGNVSALADVHANVDVAELLIYPTDLSAGDEANVQAYFKASYPSLGLP